MYEVNKNCFGTTEYSEGNFICKSCHLYRKCGKVKHKLIRLKRRTRGAPRIRYWDNE